MGKICTLSDLYTVAWCFGEYFHFVKDPGYRPDYLLSNGSAGNRAFSDLNLSKDNLDFAGITQLCAKSPDLHTKLLPSYIWHDSDKYKELLKDDPVTSIHFNFSKEVIIHCLCLDFAPSLRLVPAIRHLSPQDVLEVAPSLLSQIPSQHSKPIRIHLLVTLFG